jgi:hypothetical protein
LGVKLIGTKRSLQLVFVTLAMVIGTVAAGAGSVFAAGSVTRYVFSPTPIAPAASLAPAATVSLTLTALDSTGTAVPGATVYLRMAITTNGGSSAVGATSIGTASAPFTANGSGQITIVFTAGTATAGKDSIAAENAPSNPTVSAGTSYWYTPVARYSLNPAPIAPAGTLLAGSSVNVALVALNQGGTGIPNNVVYLSLVQGGGGGTAAVGTTALTSTPTAFTTDGAGKIVITYKTPATLNSCGCLDSISVRDTAVHWAILQNDDYLYVPAGALSASPSTVGPGGSVTATWSGVKNPTATDWIALYSAGAPNSALISWRYTTGTASGNVPFGIPSVNAGTYELRLFAKSSFTLIATSGPITVQGATLSASPSTAGPGGTVTATWSGIASPTSGDWIALYTAGAPNSSLITWRYTGGAASGSVPFSIPSVSPGTYELRLLANSSFALLATSGPITVQGATLSASPSAVGPGGTVTATWSGITSPTSGDWIALYSAGAPNSALISWRYTGGTAGGSVPFSIPSVSPGTYELRLFANSSFALLATSGPITVQGATLSASPSPVSPGGTVTATWSAITSPTSGDWIALYSAGAPNSAIIVWRFTTGSASGSVPFTIPASVTPGTYELRLFANSSFALLATTTITVQ